MKISKKKIFSFVILLTLAFSFFPFYRLDFQALAQSSPETRLFTSQEGMAEIGGVYGNKRPQDIRLMAAKFIRLILSFLGTIFLVLIMAAGFQWMTSGGNEEKTLKAKNLLVNAVIGLAIILVAWSIATYLIYVFNKIIINQTIDYINV